MHPKASDELPTRLIACETAVSIAPVLILAALSSSTSSRAEGRKVYVSPSSQITLNHVFGCCGTSSMTPREPMIPGYLIAAHSVAVLWCEHQEGGTRSVYLKKHTGGAPTAVGCSLSSG
jgi:hypothetical protein